MTISLALNFSASLCAPRAPRAGAARLSAVRPALAPQPRRRMRVLAMDGEKQATLEQQYTYHTPGSVQEPGAEEKVVFAHMLPENADKWKGTNIQHVGDTPAGRPCKRLAVVIGEFHDQLMNACLDDARLSAEAMGSKVTDVVWVPGTYEAPLVVRNLLKRDDIDAVVIVGYIEKGSTLHGEEMGSTCSPIFKSLELEFNKPVGMGIIGPGATAEQAASRVAYAGNATRAAIRMCHYMDSVRLA